MRNTKCDINKKIKPIHHFNVANTWTNVKIPQRNRCYTSNQGEFNKVTECKTFSFQQVFNIKVIEFLNIKICTLYYIYRIFSLD